MIAVLALALAFAPPLDRPLRYAVIERRPRPDGGESRTTLDETASFAAEPDGYAMTIRATGYRSDLPLPERNAMDAALRPMVGVAIHIHVTTGGVPERVIDGAASWAALVASLRAQVAAYPPGDPAAVPATRMLAAMAAAPAAARDQRLMAAADDVLGSHLPPLDVGARAATDTGSIERMPDGAGDLRYRELSRRPGATPVETDSAIAIARDTGLIRHIVRRTTMIGATVQLVSESETIGLP